MMFAEARRFELLVRLLARQFSKLLVSATHPNFLLRFLSNAVQRYVFFVKLQTIEPKKCEKILLFLVTFSFVRAVPSVVALRLIKLRDSSRGRWMPARKETVGVRGLFVAVRLCPVTAIK